MLNNWIGIFALLAVHLGFAALLGAFARQARTYADKALTALGVLLYLGSSLWLPLSWLTKAVTWLASVVLFTYFVKRPLLASWPTRWVWSYAGIAMLLILIWSAAQSQLSPAIALSAAAAWAGILAWRRGLQAHTS